jgi:hypothetical protein
MNPMPSPACAGIQLGRQRVRSFGQKCGLEVRYVFSILMAK